MPLHGRGAVRAAGTLSTALAGAHYGRAAMMIANLTVPLVAVPFRTLKNVMRRNRKITGS